MRQGDLLSTSDILGRLVSFDTTSRNSNLELIGWIRDYLDGWNVPYRESRNEAGEKANLHAIIGPEIAGGLAFSGHVDTVPVDGQTWRTDPFALTDKDGRLHARGATDMKGFVAAMLAAVPDLARARRATPIHLMITFDEEVNCAGAHVLVRDMTASGLKPALCIVGEPSGLRPIVAHKGRLSARVDVRGQAAHSADPSKGVNAVHAAAQAVVLIADGAARLEREGARADGFTPPHSTSQCGLFSGGAILNIVPDAARFDIEWRIIPGDDARALLRAWEAEVEARIASPMRAVDPDAGFTTTILHELPPLSLPETHPLASLVANAVGDNQARPGRVSYGTEAGIYQRAGIASIVCGPGDIARAHRPDEWIGRDELEACDAFLRRAAARADEVAAASPKDIAEVGAAARNDAAPVASHVADA